MKNFLLLSICLIFGGCAGDDIKPPDLSAVTGKVDSAITSVGKASKIVDSSKKVIEDVANTGSKPNDIRVLKLQSDNAELSTLLFKATQDLQSANSIVGSKQSEVDAITKERNELKPYKQKYEELIKVTNHTNLVIAVMAVAFFFVGQLMVKVYASQITAFIPILGGIASEILGFIGGAIAFSIFFLLLALFQGPLGWIMRLFL